MNISNGFDKALEGYKIEKLEQHAGTIYGFRGDFTLAYFNSAWTTFAKSNDGEPCISSSWNLGANIFKAIPDSLHSFYAALYKKCMTDFKAQGFYYECSSPDTIRKFSQLTYPLKTDGFLSVHSLISEQSVDTAGREPTTPDSSVYKDKESIHQCSHCRRTKNMTLKEQWDWVPSLLKNNSIKISHGLCPTCLGYFRQLDSEGTDFSLITPPFPE